MLFALGMISLFTGHVASDLDWYSQRLVKRSLSSRLEGSKREEIDIWKSKYANYFYGCTQPSSHFLSASHQRSSNGYLLIGASGGLNQQRTGVRSLFNLYDFVSVDGDQTFLDKLGIESLYWRQLDIPICNYQGCASLKPVGTITGCWKFHHLVL